MQLQHTDSSKWTITLQRFELDTLMVAAKRILNGHKGRIPRQAKSQLRDIVDSYEAECRQLYEASQEASFTAKNGSNSSDDMVA